MVFEYFSLKNDQEADSKIVFPLSLKIRSPIKICFLLWEVHRKNVYQNKKYLRDSLIISAIS